MKLGKSQIILGALVAVVVLGAMGYRSYAAQVSRTAVVTLPQVSANPVVSQ